jgi:hypothetical protein
VRAAAAALAAACLFATDAHAAQGLGGVWAFETSPHRQSGCIISGEALVRATTQADRFTVSLRAAERCPDGSAWRADEDCVARRTRQALNVTCTLVRALPSDQFNLNIESAELMRGRLFDHGAWDEPVRWRRISGALIS